MEPVPDAGMPQSSFLLLPTEVRLKIYAYALSWPNLRQLFAQTYENCQHIELKFLSGLDQESRLRPKSSVAMASILPTRQVTPTCLLINRQITAEALPCLYSQILEINALPPYTQLLGRPMDITSFLCEAALQRAQRVTLYPDFNRDLRGWSKLVELLLDIWCDKNHLLELKVVLDPTIPLQESPSQREEGHRIRGSGLGVIAKLRRFGATILHSD
ncbi:hypothetical protein BGZ63DRAFT_388373 [Mariannaea sp. PMI_226]|nr:hypothetical protein BGZ63DRAFT_388373 [Mariannaea sp. PMI_226]